MRCLPLRSWLGQAVRLQEGLATAAGVFLSTSTALFIAIIAAFVSFALTAFTVFVNFAP